MGEMVSYPGADGNAEGYLALPEGGGDRPAVLVLHEAWGLLPHIRSVADRFAEAGFVALAPDLFRGATASEREQGRKLVAELPADRAAGDLTGAAGFLAGRPEVTGRVAAVGFSTGGSLALWSVTLTDRIVAAAAFYPSLRWGQLDPDWSGYAGRDALVHCSEADGTSAAEHIKAVRQGVEAAGGCCRLYDYPDTKHSFFNDDRPERFDQPAAGRAWARTLEFLRARVG
ncbi:dienelactone hydrolase family protein [Micromonospora zhanjiangensis]|uniref:Dienelactone hydrolase family protein n=1 Tax=Micromonospora zhanjiangensis TaxID=1522057 RepID=A0ABV8KRV0_9ACTN